MPDSVALVCVGAATAMTHTGESDGDDEQYLHSFTDEDDTLPWKCRIKTHTHIEDMRKPVLVDSKGIPYGTMKKVLEYKVKLLAKDLENRYSWERQASICRCGPSSATPYPCCPK